MIKQSFRQVVADSIRENASGVIKAIEASGVALNEDEMQALRGGNLDIFSDQQLQERFNRKVLGILGIESRFLSEGSPKKES